MRAYLDSSALLKRVVDEPQSSALQRALRTFVDADAALITSSLGWVEVARALRRASTLVAGLHPDRLTDDALAGVLERPIGADVVALARRVGPAQLRNLDAIHVATAILVDADVVVSYDERLIDAAHEHGLSTSSPGDRWPRSELLRITDGPVG